MSLESCGIEASTHPWGKLTFEMMEDADGPLAHDQGTQFLEGMLVNGLSRMVTMGIEEFATLIKYVVQNWQWPGKKGLNCKWDNHFMLRHLQRM